MLNRKYLLLASILLKPKSSLAQHSNQSYNILDSATKIDIGTALGLLGVALTIIFFIVGYRQTIGARKERAHAATREIVDILLRRLVLEVDFQLTTEDISKLIKGKALEHRILPRDMLSLEEIEAILFSRVLESDYIPAEQRKPILNKLSKAFQEPTHTIEFTPQLTRSSTVWSPTAVLATFSALAALGVVFGVLLALRFKSQIQTMNEFDRLLPTALPIASLATVMTGVTAILLFFYVKLRDKTSAIGPTLIEESTSNAASFEKHIIRRLQSLQIPIVIEAGDRGPDCIIETPEGRVGIEIILNGSRTGSIRLRNHINMVREYAERLGLKRLYVVSAGPVTDAVAKLGSDFVVFVSEQEFFSSLKTARVS